MQFPIQLATIRTIQRVQGLSIDNLASDLHGVSRHGLTYIIYDMHKRKPLSFFNPHQQKKNQCLCNGKEETKKLEISAKYKLSLPILKTFQISYLIIQYLKHDLFINITMM